MSFLNSRVLLCALFVVFQSSLFADAMQTISTEKLLSVGKSWKIVDTRLNDAFNGWKLDGVKRGGHIPNATDFSANWLKVDSKNLQSELKEALKNKNLTKEDNIVLYDANGKDAKVVAEYLQKQGYKHLYYYDIKNYPADKPLVKFKNFQLIVPAVTVHDILEGKTPETFPKNKKVKIVEASWGEEKTSYAKGHVPTAFHVNTDNIEPPTKTKPAMWLLTSDENLDKFAKKFGFSKDDVVVVTGAEQMAAYRVATVLLYMGVKDVRVLNGGNTAWTMAGYKLDKKSYKPTPVKSFGEKIPGNPNVIETMAEVKKDLNSSNFTLVDNRTWKEHIGEISGYSYHDKKGRVPGSVFGYAGKTDAYSLDYYRNPDKTMRNPLEIMDMWKKQGINLNNKLAFMCGSGWRVAEIYYYADVYGLKDITIFSDGWIGWSNGGNPIVIGVPKK